MKSRKGNSTLARLRNPLEREGRDGIDERPRSRDLIRVGQNPEVGRRVSNRSSGRT